MGRRGENIRYRKCDGRWEARVVCGSPMNGKTCYRYIYGKSYQEARSKKKMLEKSLEASEVYPVKGNYGGNAVLLGKPAGKTVFSDAAAAWLESRKMAVKESSLATYSCLVKRYLLPKLGDVPVESLTGKMLEDLFAWLRESGRCHGEKVLSDKTLGDIKNVLTQILSYAESHGMAASAAECPTIPSRKPTARALAPGEQERLESAALREDTAFSAAVLLLLYSGLRDGEVCGLKWGDIDLSEGVLHVRRTVSRIMDLDSGAGGARTKVIIGTPKTDCSRRTVPLPENIIRYLSERRLAAHIYVATGTSKFMEPRAFLANFRRFQMRNNLQDCTVHTLRHTFATRCIEYGVDIKSLSEIMGHSNVKTTMQLYVHPSMESKKAEVNKLPCSVG